MPARLLSTLAALLLANVGLSGTAHGQALGDTWFKVTVNVKADAISPDDAVNKGKGKVVCYVHLIESDTESPAEGNVSVVSYDYTVYSETTPDSWQASSIGTLFTTGENERIMIGPELSPSSCGIHWQIVVPDQDNTVIQVSFVARLKLAYDKQADPKQAALKKASFKSTGGLMPYGQGGGALLVGGVKLKGKLVTVDQLPFAPD